MGVDVSMSTVVGFVIPPEVLDKYIDTLGKNKYDDRYDEDEAMEHLLRKRTGLTFGMAGSYYDTDDMTAWVGVRRLTDSYDLYDMPGGIQGSSAAAAALPEITDEERKELRKAAKKVGLGKDVLIERFTAVLWH